MTLRNRLGGESQGAGRFFFGGDAGGGVGDPGGHRRAFFFSSGAGIVTVVGFGGDGSSTIGADGVHGGSVGGKGPNFWKEAIG